MQTCGQDSQKNFCQFPAEAGAVMFTLDASEINI